MRSDHTGSHWAYWGLEQVSSVGGTVLSGVCVRVWKWTENERKREDIPEIRTHLLSPVCLLQCAPLLFGFLSTRVCGRESKTT